MSEGTFGNPEIVEYETDILIIGGGMAACGAAFEAKRWAGDDVKITLVDKAAMDRSGAVAQGLSAINTYIGDNSTEDYVRMVHADLMGITRDDLVYDVGRHVDGTVHLFEEWGLPIWKTKETEGTPLAEGGKPGQRIRRMTIRVTPGLKMVADKDRIEPDLFCDTGEVQQFIGPELLRRRLVSDFQHS